MIRLETQPDQRIYEQPEIAKRLNFLHSNCSNISSYAMSQTNVHELEKLRPVGKFSSIINALPRLHELTSR